MSGPLRIVAGRRQAGVALITALLVVALATTAAVLMARQLHIDLRRTANFLHGEQAWAYALAAESWAQVVLEQDAGNNTTDSALDDWATALPPIAVEGGLVDGEVYDLQGRFNVNNLVDAQGEISQAAIDFYKRLLDRLKLGDELAVVLGDWLDEDITATFPGGVEDETYLLLDPPYRAANRLMTDISELRLLQGYTPDVIEALAPHVTALPQATPININTATPVVLLAFDNKLTEADVESVVEQRTGEAYTDFQDMLNDLNLSAPPAGIGLSVDSQWFRVLTDVRVGAGRSRVASLVYRDGSRSRVYQRTRGDHRLLAP